MSKKRITFSPKIRIGLTYADQLARLICASILGKDGKIHSGYLLSIKESHREKKKSCRGEHIVTTTLTYRYGGGMDVILYMSGKISGAYGMEWRLLSARARFFHEDLKFTRDGKKKIDIVIPLRILHDEIFREFWFSYKARQLGLTKKANLLARQYRTVVLAKQKLMLQALELARSNNGVCYIVYVHYLQKPDLHRDASSALRTELNDKHFQVYQLFINQIEDNLALMEVALHSPNPDVYLRREVFGTPISSKIYIVGNNNIKLNDTMEQKYPYLYHRKVHGHHKDLNRGIVATEQKRNR